MRGVDGQVRGGLAMLPAGSRRQPGCFLAQTVQAPFVFGSVDCRALNGVTLAREHPTTQPYVLAQVRLLERPFRSVEAARAANICTPGARAGCWELPAGTAQLAMVTGAAKAYTGEAAARPPGRWEGAEVLLTRTLPTDVRRVQRGGNDAIQQTKLTTLCPQVAPSSVRGAKRAEWTTTSALKARGQSAQPWRATGGSGQQDAATNHQGQ